MRSDFQIMSAQVEALLARHGRMAGGGANFRWECDDNGAIILVEGVERGALIGSTLVLAATPGATGADMRIVDAFRARRPFRDLPFHVGGVGPAAGEWRMAGVPVFDGRGGSFRGFRGSAQRAGFTSEDHASHNSSMPAATALDGLPSDSVRQLVHELRTPLNAIAGFAEMIDGQHLGPAGAGYRARAAGIRHQAAQLLAAVEDLDQTARVQTAGRPGPGTDLSQLLGLLERRAGGQWPLRLDIAGDLPLAALAEELAERLLSRLCEAMQALLPPGEVAPGRLFVASAEPCLLLTITLTGHVPDGSASLLLPGGDGSGADPAAALDVGFTLRLIRRMAESAGGTLRLDHGNLSLRLPIL